MYISSKETNKRNLLTTTHTSPLSSTPPRAAIREICRKRYLKKTCIHQKRPTKETNVYWKRPTKETQRKTNIHQNRPTKIERDLQKRPTYIKRHHKRDLRVSKKTYKWNQRTSKETNKRDIRGRKSASLTATHCNTLQHTATHCNTLQHTATHCNTLQHTATHCNTLQQQNLRPSGLCWVACGRTSARETHERDGCASKNYLQKRLTHGNTLQHAIMHCNTTRLRPSGLFEVARCRTAARRPYQRDWYISKITYGSDSQTGTRRNMLQHTATRHTWGRLDCVEKT